MSEHAISLDKPMTLTGREWRDHPAYDDAIDGVHVSWGFRRPDGTTVGGAYASHEGARVTALQFPQDFAGAVIYPFVSTRRGRYFDGPYPGWVFSGGYERQEIKGLIGPEEAPEDFFVTWHNARRGEGY